MRRRRPRRSSYLAPPLVGPVVLAEDFSKLIKGPARFRVPSFMPARARQQLLN